MASGRRVYIVNVVKGRVSVRGVHVREMAGWPADRCMDTVTGKVIRKCDLFETVEDALRKGRDSIVELRDRAAQTLARHNDSIARFDAGDFSVIGGDDE